MLITDEENKNVSQETQPNDDTAQDYIDAIKNIKANSVDRSKYEQLRAEHKKLLQSVVNGQPGEQQTPEEPQADVQKLRDHLFHTDGISNLDYWQTALELREALIAKGERDPFLPYGQKISPTYEDAQAAERVVDVVKQCIDYAEGDSQVFTNELQRRIVDSRYR